MPLRCKPRHDRKKPNNNDILRAPQCHLPASVTYKPIFFRKCLLFVAFLAKMIAESEILNVILSIWKPLLIHFVTFLYAKIQTYNFVKSNMYVQLNDLEFGN